MNANEYLDAAKQAMNITSDYELANRFGLHRSRISSYRKGREWPDNYVVMLLAITLKLDPARVLADLESQREKDPKRREFWQGFLSRAVMLALITSTLLLGSIGNSGPEAPVLGGLVAASAAFFYAVWVRIIGDSDNCWLSHRENR